MKEKKNGFTLIELLAVIVILAIIALIATPIVLNLINKARKGAFARSAEGVLKASKLYYAQSLLDIENASDITFKCDNKECISETKDSKGNPIKLDVDGNVGTGEVTIYNDGKISISLCNANDCATKTKDEEKITVTKKDPVTPPPTPSGPTTVLTDLPTGVKAIVYLDPTDLSKTCNASNSSVGGTAKSGCMKWYAFKEDSSSYTMILDHNTTAKVAWNSSGSNTSMKEVQTALTSDTTGWAGSPRLITGKEIADITGNTSWTTSTTSSGWFYFDSNNQTQTATSTGSSKYYWLYDYTNGCTSNGCKVADSSTYGYWTSTPVSGSTYDAWRVNGNGSLRSYSVGSISRCGVRPVITISKSSL